MSNSTPSATTTTGYNSSPSLSPQRKVSRSARLCHSFRRTLRRNSPGGKKALAQTDSNASAPTALLSSLGEQQQLLNSDVNKGSQNSVLNAVMNGRTSSFSQLQQKESRLASSEVSKKDDSVEQTPEKKQQQKQQADDNRRNSSSSPLSSEFSFVDNFPRNSLTPSNAASSFSSATKLFGNNNNTENGLATATSLLTTLTESSAILVRRLSKAFFQAQDQQHIGGSLFLF
uniref:Uncharacterized protein n=1 Tax=Meloidogyne javanica TaxID=6303 RepID=A0A915M7Q5_MELJA